MGTTVTVKAPIEKVCIECGGTFAGRGRSKTCSSVCAFWTLVDRTGGPDACWPWRGACWPSGYGVVPSCMTPDGMTGRAHRVAWWLHNTCDPGRLGVLHRCDNRCCANPAHLFIGSQRANVLDAVSKGRHRIPPMGDKHHKSKLTSAAVRQIRSQPDAAEDLARRFGVSVGTIRSAAAGRTWRHVE